MEREPGPELTLEAALHELLLALAPRAGSLAVTVFGDSIATQGNSVWLGGLVTVMERFALNARQIRIAIFRLGRDGWLRSAQRGRRSYYGFSDLGEGEADEIEARLEAGIDGYHIDQGGFSCAQ